MHSWLWEFHQQGRGHKTVVWGVVGGRLGLMVIPTKINLRLRDKCGDHPLCLMCHDHRVGRLQEGFTGRSVEWSVWLQIVFPPVLGGELDIHEDVLQLP